MIKYTLIFVAIVLAAPMAFGDALFFFTFTASSTGATATGQFSIDSSNIFTGANSVSELTDLSITVSGATAGNGTFPESDFTTFIWDSGDPTSDFNFAQNLVGQNGFGTSNGDFTFLSSPSAPLAPYGTGPYTLTAEDGSANDMFLTFLQEMLTPELAAIGLTGLGLVAIFAIFRRRAFGSR
jgi:hypothetical protein